MLPTTNCKLYFDCLSNPFQNWKFIFEPNINIQAKKISRIILTTSWENSVCNGCKFRLDLHIQTLIFRKFRHLQLYKLGWFKRLNVALKI